jgi:peptidoglycan/LPS O-acetylase OafA/YrhL
MLLLIAGIFIGSYPVELPVQGTIYAFLDGLARIRTYQILGAAFIMTALIKLPWLQSLLSRGPLVLLGKISFSLYLLHVIIMGSLSNHLFMALTRHVSYLHAFIITFLISLPIIFTASYLAYRYVDQSSVRASQWAYGYVLERTRGFTSFFSTRLPLFMKRGQSSSGAPCEEVTLGSLPAEQGRGHES